MLLNRRRIRTGIVAMLGAMMLSPLALASANDADADPAQWRSISLAHALEAAALVEDPYRRAESFAAIARAQALLEGPAVADRSIRQALEATKAISAPEFQGW